MDGGFASALGTPHQSTTTPNTGYGSTTGAIPVAQGYAVVSPLPPDSDIHTHRKEFFAGFELWIPPTPNTVSVMMCVVAAWGEGGGKQVNSLRWFGEHCIALHCSR